MTVKTRVWMMQVKVNKMFVFQQSKLRSLAVIRQNGKLSMIHLCVPYMKI